MPLTFGGVLNPNWLGGGSASLAVRGVTVVTSKMSFIDGRNAHPPGLTASRNSIRTMVPEYHQGKGVRQTSQLTGCEIAVQVFP